MLCTLSVYVCRPQLPPTAFLYQLTQPHPIIKLYCSVFYCLEFQWYFSPPPRKKWPPHYYICSHNTANPSSTHTVWSSYQTVTDPYPVTQAVWLACKCITKLLCVFRTGWSWLSITEQKCKDSFTPYTVLQCCMAWLSGSKPHARTPHVLPTKEKKGSFSCILAFCHHTSESYKHRHICTDFPTHPHILHTIKGQKAGLWL